VVLNSTIVNTARIFGPTLAGVLIITVGYGWCFTFDALSYLAVLACLWLMRQRELYPAEHRPKQRGEIREGLRYVRSSPRLLTSFIMLAVIGTLTYNFNITLPLFVSDVLGRTNTTFTFLYSVFSLGAVMCALVVAQRGLVEMKHIILGAAGLGATMLLLALTSNVAVAAFCTLLLGVSSTLYMTSTTALTQLEASPAVRGRVLALQSVLLVGTTPVGGPVLGLLADAAGGRLPLILGGIVALFAAFYGHVAMRNMQHPKTQ
jgi:predicted MFS family arabinose efflux permease